MATAMGWPRLALIEKWKSKMGRWCTREKVQERDLKDLVATTRLSVACFGGQIAS